MLERYIEILKEATQNLSNLGMQNSDITDYFRAVGYEFLVVFLGVTWLAIIVCVILLPFILGNRIIKLMIRKIDKEIGTIRSSLNEMFELQEEFHSMLRSSFKNKLKCWKKSYKIHKQYLMRKQMSIYNEQEAIFDGLLRLAGLTDDFTSVPDKNKATIDEIVSEVKSLMELAVDQKQEALERLQALVTKENRIKVASYVTIYFVWLMLVIPLVLMFF